MPPNNPFIPPYISRYLEIINRKWNSSAMEAIRRDIRQIDGALPETAIKPGQSKRVMRTPSEIANYLGIQTQLLGRQLGRPMKALDVGTYSGSAALAMAEAMGELPHRGEVISCEFDERHADFAEEHWKQSPVKKRITMARGKAEDIMQDMLGHGQKGTFDLVFIDADKLGYESYYEKALALLRPGGMIVIDNALWSGYAAQVGKHSDADTLAIQALNKKISEDPRVDAVLTGNEDGVWTILKRYTEKFQERLDKERKKPTNELRKQ